MLEIKQFTTADYQTIADLENSVFTDEFFTGQGIEDDEKRLPDYIKQQRFVAWQDGIAVGFGQFSQDAWQYHPNRFRFWILVRPEYQRLGIGAKLWDAVFGAVQVHSPIGYLSSVREDKFGLEFLKTRGFSEKMRTWENRIDLRQFDASPYQHLPAELEQQGIQILSLEQLMQQHADYATRYFEVSLETGRDVPRAYPATDRTFEEWSVLTLENPKSLEKATFIAVQDGRYIGVSALYLSDGDYLTIGLTGVRREFRNKQIALAVKVACLAWAKENGYLEVRTWNDSNNLPILKLNQKLGFVQCPAWIDCVLELPVG